MRPNGGPPDPDLVIDVSALRHDQDRLTRIRRQQNITLALSIAGWAFLFGVLAGNAGMPWWAYGAVVVLAMANGYVAFRQGSVVGQLEVTDAILQRLEAILDERDKD